MIIIVFLLHFAAQQIFEGQFCFYAPICAALSLGKFKTRKKHFRSVLFDFSIIDCCCYRCAVLIF